MPARHDTLWATDAVFPRDDVRAETVSHVVIFHRDSLALRHDGFKLSKIENNIGTIETPLRATNDFARSIFEFLVNHFLLDLANPLHHRLFSSLLRDTAESFRHEFTL